MSTDFEVTWIDDRGTFIKFQIQSLSSQLVNPKIVTVNNINPTRLKSKPSKSELLIWKFGLVIYLLLNPPFQLKQSVILSILQQFPYT